jgi:hypothetical protein
LLVVEPPALFVAVLICSPTRFCRFSKKKKEEEDQDYQPVAFFCFSKINWCLHPTSGMWDSFPRQWFTDPVSPKIDWRLPTRYAIFGFTKWWPSGSRAVALAGRLVD